MTARVYEISSHPRFKQVAEPWVSKRELAAHLGYSSRWVEIRMREGLPCQMFGGHRRFRISEVEQWLREEDSDDPQAG